MGATHLCEEQPPILRRTLFKVTSSIHNKIEQVEV